MSKHKNYIEIFVDEQGKIQLLINNTDFLTALGMLEYARGWILQRNGEIELNKLKENFVVKELNGEQKPLKEESAPTCEE